MDAQWIVGWLGRLAAVSREGDPAGANALQKASEMLQVRLDIEPTPPAEPHLCSACAARLVR